MKIHLRLLDKLPSFGYGQTIPVYIDDIFTCIGECEIVRDKETGGHIGDLRLNRDVPKEYFLIYRSSATEIPVFFLTELLFTAQSLKGQESSTFGACLIQE